MTENEKVKGLLEEKRHTETVAALNQLVKLQEQIVLLLTQVLQKPTDEN